jgi:signal transduction histidine kinase/DNA-binding response OmpR family regulator
MNNHDRFQDIVLSIANELININTDEFHQKIENALAMVGDFLDVDRVYVFEYDYEKRFMNNTFEWCNQGVSKEIDNLQQIDMDMFDDVWVKYHKIGQPAIYEDVNALDKEHLIYQILEPQGVKSVTTLPLMDNQKCLGFVGFDDVRNKRQWNNSEMNLLKVLSEVITNATLKQEQQKKLIELKQKADEASLEKNQFLAKISHEFRTPLHGISNALYLLESTDLTSEQKEYHDIATYSTKALMSMISDLLDISKIESGQIDIFEDVFNLENELTNMILTILPKAQEKGLLVDFEFDYQMNYNHLGDYTKIRQIILNLLSNAIKYTQQGKIKINVNRIAEENIYDVIRFSIEDTGIGIDHKHIDKIFDKFYQVDSGDSRKYEGTGLGLSIVKELIQTLGSKIELETSLNDGSKFSFDLKLKKQGHIDFKEVKGFKVLLTDQDELMNHFCKVFESMGMHVYYDTKDESVLFDLIIFNNEKSLELVDFYKNNFAKPTTLFVKIGELESIHHLQVTLYFQKIMSRKTMYQKIVGELFEKKQGRFDRYNEALSGYALVVDDNRLNRIALENILKKQGIHSKLVDGGKKAIEAAKNERFDIILMDIQMPEMDGIEASKSIRNLGPQYAYIPIIGVTANAFLNDYDLMKEAQMNDVLFKPIHIDALERILRKHLSVQKQIFVPASFLVFDQKDYLYRFDESIDIAKSVVEAFLGEYKKDMQSIRQAIESKNRTEIKEKLHYFKGSCSYLSGKRTTWLLTNMMEFNEKNDQSSLEKAYEVLSYEVIKLVDTLKTFLEKLT